MQLVEHWSTMYLLLILDASLCLEGHSKGVDGFSESELAVQRIQS